MFRIAVRPYARAVGLLKAGIALVAILAAIGFGSDVGDEISSSEEETEWLYAVLLLCVAGAFGAARVFWSNLRSALVRKPTLKVGTDGLVIHHEGVFKKPVRISHEDIRVVSFDDRPARRRGRDHPRFSLAGTDDHGPGWLYSRTTGSPFPVIGQVPDAPNLAIVFARPVELPKPRRFVKAFPSKQVFFPPLDGRPSRGLLLRMKDPERTRLALAEHHEVRPLNLDDLEPPDERSRSRASRLTLRDNLVMGTLIVVQFALPIALAEDSDKQPPGSETFSALGQICGVGTIETLPLEPASESLGDLLVRDRAGMSLMFDSVIDTGDAALFARGDVGRWTQELLDADFQRGYARRWSGSGLVLFATVWEFPSPERAVELELFARNETCRFVQDAFLVPDLPGAVGYTVFTPERSIDQVSFVRGRYRFLVGAETAGDGGDRSSLLSLIRAVVALW